MRERPILFSAPMVRALLDGTKMQTRRVVRKQFAPDSLVSEVAATTPEGWQVRGHSGLWWDDAGACLDDAIRCPYGMPGDRLWVRETWMDLQGTGVEVRTGDRSRYAYGADTPPGSYGDEARKDYGLKWRPSIHMPRAVSRITLDVTGVRVERLKDISVKDARAEGVTFNPMLHTDEREAFMHLWQSINGAESWHSNPWVWVVEFKRVEAA